MAEGQKSEKATAKRRRDERKKGNVFKSNDAVSVLVLISSFFAIWLTAPAMAEEIRSFMYYCITMPLDQPVMHTGDNITNLLDEFVASFVVAIGPVVLTGIAVALGATFFQTRMLITFETMKPQFNRMNPIEGVKRLFSARSAVEAIKGVLKISILLYLIYRYLLNVVDALSKYMYTDLLAACSHLFDASFEVVFQISLAFVVLAGADIYFQWWDYERKLRMTKQEVKEEYKQMEGDPKIKSKIREVQRKMAQSRMMQKVSSADVVVRNPTHFAVALRYKSDVDSAPIVLAKGQDEVAMRIIAVANEHKVLVVENVPLARALYATTELGREIPSELYNAVAEVLVYLYKVSGKIKS